MTDERADPIPWRVGTPRCGAHSTTGFKGAPSQCSAPVTHAGLRVGGQPVQAWPAFACALRASELTALRELLDRDRAVLADWADRKRRPLVGKGWGERVQNRSDHRPRIGTLVRDGRSTSPARVDSTSACR